jgi:cyclophilin family peptidyl-prolyl cis-trans isomerase
MKQIMIALITMITVWACNGQDSSKVESKDQQSNTEQIQTEETTIEKSKTEKLILGENEMAVAIINTNMGKIEIELFADQTPKTVENFVGLANEKYYNGIIFHRVIPNFMNQSGDPTGTGRGGESIWGKPFADEIVPSLVFDEPGILAMANSGPNTNGSQFFITVAATTWLNGNHTIFGKVIEGMDVVYAISKVQTSKPGDKPLKDVVMESVVIEKREKI